MTNNKNDYGYFGTGFSGYVHYKEEFDKSFPKDEPYHSQPVHHVTNHQSQSSAPGTKSTQKAASDDYHSDLTPMDYIKVIAMIIGVYFLVLGVPMVFFTLLTGSSAAGECATAALFVILVIIHKLR